MLIQYKAQVPLKLEDYGMMLLYECKKRRYLFKSMYNHDNLSFQKVKMIKLAHHESHNQLGS